MIDDGPSNASKTILCKYSWGFHLLRDDLPEVCVRYDLCPKPLCNKIHSAQPLILTSRSTVSNLSSMPQCILSHQKRAAHGEICLFRCRPSKGPDRPRVFARRLTNLLAKQARNYKLSSVLVGQFVYSRRRNTKKSSLSPPSFFFLVGLISASNLFRYPKFKNRCPDQYGDDHGCRHIP